MKSKELKKLTKNELELRLTEKKKELRDLEFDIKIGQAQDYSSRIKIRKEVARILTLINNNLFAKESESAEKAKPSSSKTGLPASRHGKKSDKSVKITKPAKKDK